MTYREAFDMALGSLSEAGVEFAETESRLMMEYVCGIDLGFYLMHSEEEMPAEQAESYLALAQKRCTHIPLQYLTGEQEFMGLLFHVNEHVLIPRQDTEVLTEEAIRILEGMRAQRDPLETGSLRVLDMCTGTGCIAISIKTFCPDVEVCASDVSGEALRTARENADINRADVEWIQSDLFSGIEGIFDLITCNPPYIPTDVLETLMPEVRDHEPRIALDGGADGLGYYRRILADCGPHIRRGGFLLTEIGSDQADAVGDLMRGNGFGQIRIFDDLNGMKRIAAGRRD